MAHLTFDYKEKQIIDFCTIFTTMSKYEPRYKSTFEPVDLPKDKSTFLHLECPSCRDKVHASEINISDKIAKCNSCSAVFSFENDLLDLAQNKAEIKKPVKVEKMYFGDELEISINNPFQALTIIFLSLAPLFILASAGLFFAEGIAFAGVVMAVLIFLFSFNIFRLILPGRRKVFFVANKEYLTVEFPKNSLTRNKEFRKSDIEQLYVSKSAEGFRLMAIVDTSKGQKHIPVISYLKSVTIAKYLEQELEKHLEIPNKKVSNEIE